MGKMIAYCGLDCAACDAYIATQNNDQALKEKTAAEWSKNFGFDFTPDMINCTSCQGSGVKVGNCYECGVRKCSSEKGLANCGVCGDFKDCETINGFFAQMPDDYKNKLLENLGQK
jgi:hypothetical protein